MVKISDDLKSIKW